MPKGINLKFKNDEYFSKKKTEVKEKKQNNPDLFSNEENNIDVGKFNSAGIPNTADNLNKKTNSFEVKNNKQTNIDLNNLISGNIINPNTENDNDSSKENKTNINNDLGFSFPSRNFFYNKFLENSNANNLNNTTNTTINNSNSSNLLEGFEFTNLNQAKTSDREINIGNNTQKKIFNSSNNLNNPNANFNLEDVFSKSQNSSNFKKN